MACLSTVGQNVPGRMKMKTDLHAYSKWIAPNTYEHHICKFAYGENDAVTIEWRVYTDMEKFKRVVKKLRALGYNFK